MKHTLLCLSFLAASFSGFSQYSPVRDINSGVVSSSPTRLTVLNKKLVFFADDGSNGVELWAVDSSGANIAYNINPGPTSSATSVNYLTMAVANGKIYFPADNGTQGPELYSWDGVNPPVLAYDLHPGVTGSVISEVAALNNRIYFSANDPVSGNELFVFDPATNITQKLTDINPGIANSNPQNLVAYKGKLLFAAVSAVSGNELFLYDPITNNTTMVYDINTGAASSDPQSMMVIGDNLYFSAVTNVSGRELYKYDSLNVTRISDLNVSINSSILASAIGQNRIGGLNNTVYFAGDNGTSGQQVYKYNASNGSSTIFYKINTTGNSNPNGFTNYGNKLFFAANDFTHGNELWATDGTTTSLMADIDSGANSSNPMNMAVYNGRLYFAATTATTGVELFMYADSALGVQNIRFDGDVKIYPNPASADAYIDMTLKTSQTLNVRVADITGHEVFNTGMKAYSAGNTKITVPMGNLSAGTYLYSITGNEGRNYVSGKLLKQ